MSEGVVYLFGAQAVEASVEQLSPEDRNVAELEQKLLGALLIQPQRNVPALPENLGPHHFLVDGHDRIFQAILAAAERGGEMILPVVRAAVPDLDGPDRYIETLIHAFIGCRPEDVRMYAEDMLEAAARREALKMLETARAHLAPVSGEAKPVSGVLSGMELEIERITAAQPKSTPAVAFGAALTGALELSDLNYNRVGPPGLPTSIAAWDDLVGGLEPKLFYIDAARPGVGKTARALSDAIAVARSGVPVAFFSKEMSKEQLAWRALSMATGIDYDTLRRGRFHNDPRLVEAVVEADREMKRLPLFIDDSSGLSMVQIKLRAKAMKRRAGALGVVWIDTLNKVAPTGAQDRHGLHFGMTQSAGAGKDMAKELDLAVVALCQLSRKVEEREDKRPVISDLRESGALEENADVVTLMYRHEYYLKNALGKTRLAESPEKAFERERNLELEIARHAGKGELILGKLRHGNPRTLHVCFDGWRTLWHDQPGYCRQDCGGYER